MKDKNLLVAIALCLTMGLAPFFPEPHIWGKLKWLAGGAEGMSAVDYFDLVLHGAPWVSYLLLLPNALRRMPIKFPAEWSKQLGKEESKPYFKSLLEFIDQEYKNQSVLPPKNKVFSAFERISFSDVKVVIIGQDPYHGLGQANGLAFSVNPGVKIPPSLRNIFKEIQRDLSLNPPVDGDLSFWADQGVLLLNSTLTVREGQAGSHQKKGWEEFTDAVIKELVKEKSNLVYMLWGTYAQKKASMVDEDKNLVLKAVHPSPLSAHRGFFGCAHFSKCNAYLEGIGESPIKWVRTGQTLFG